MNEYIKKFKTAPMMWILVIVLLAYFPTALASAPETDKRAISVELAIDKGKIGIQASISMLTPHTSSQFAQKTEIVSADKPTLSEALRQISINVGKRVALSHVDLIIISQELAKENLVTTFDNLLRAYDLSNDTIIIVTNKTAKEMLEASQKLQSATGIPLYQILLQNKVYSFFSDSSLETFLKGFYSYDGASVLRYVKLTNDPNLGISPSGSSETPPINSSPQGSSSKSIDNMFISCTFSAGLFKNGILVDELNQEHIRGLNLLAKNISQGSLSIKDPNYSLIIPKKDVKLNAKFQNLQPVLEVTLRLDSRLEEDNNKHTQDYSTLASNTNFVNQKVNQKISNKIKELFFDAFKICKKHNADLLAFTQMFKTLPEYNNFVNSLQSDDYLLNHLVFKISTNVVQID
ncbi:MAG: Ger(x)C family spore germination C-terminal domain-containing protein [Clostridia bacterium]